MKAITTIFESILVQNETPWTPVEGPIEFAAGPKPTGWGWGT